MPLKDMFTDVPAQTNKMVCWDCGEEISPTDIQCPHCHADLKEKMNSPETDRSASLEQRQLAAETDGQERYPVLNTISGIYELIGVLAGVIAFIAAVIERVFAAIPAIYSGVKANYTINIFQTDEESTLFTARFFNLLP